MASNQSRSAPEEGQNPERPRRFWDGRSWVEALVFRRDRLGRWTNKNGLEPFAQLLLPFG